MQGHDELIVFLKERNGIGIPLRDHLLRRLHETDNPGLLASCMDVGQIGADEFPPTNRVAGHACLVEQRLPLVLGENRRTTQEPAYQKGYG